MPHRNKRKRGQNEEALAGAQPGLDLEKTKVEYHKYNEGLRQELPLANGSWSPQAGIDAIEFTELFNTNQKSETLTTPNYLLQVFESLERMSKAGELCDLEIGRLCAYMYLCCHCCIYTRKSGN